MSGSSGRVRSVASPVVLTVAGFYLLLLVLLVFWPARVDTGIRPVLRDWLGDRGLDRASAASVYASLEFAANVVLFAPMGVLAHRLAKRVGSRIPLLVVFAAPVAAELGQWLFLPARVPDPRDIMAGFVGLGIGVGIDLVLVRRRQRREAASAESDSLG